MVVFLFKIFCVCTEPLQQGCSNLQHSRDGDSGIQESDTFGTSSTSSTVPVVVRRITKKTITVESGEGSSAGEERDDGGESRTPRSSANAAVVNISPVPPLLVTQDDIADSAVILTMLSAADPHAAAMELDTSSDEATSRAIVSKALVELHSPPAPSHLSSPRVSNGGGRGEPIFCCEDERSERSTATSKRKRQSVDTLLEAHSAIDAEWDDVHWSGSGGDGGDQVPSLLRPTEHQVGDRAEIVPEVPNNCATTATAQEAPAKTGELFLHQGVNRTSSRDGELAGSITAPRAGLRRRVAADPLLDVNSTPPSEEHGAAATASKPKRGQLKTHDALTGTGSSAKQRSSEGGDQGKILQQKEKEKQKKLQKATVRYLGQKFQCCTFYCVTSFDWNRRSWKL